MRTRLIAVLSIGALATLGTGCGDTRGQAGMQEQQEGTFVNVRKQEREREMEEAREANP